MITGATGFAGSFLLERYLAAGWDAHATYRRPEQRDVLSTAGARPHCIDLLDADKVARTIADIEPNVVQHLAAQSSVSASLTMPWDTLFGNIRQQFNVLSALNSLGCDRCVVVGSCDEYGTVLPEANPVSEDQPLLPVNPYAVSKVTQDLMGYQFFASYGLPVVRVRPFLQIGPRRSDVFVAGSFARQVAEIHAGKHSAVIEVGNIDLRRDFTDVRDMVEALVLVAECGEPGQVYNIASECAHSLRELLRIMVESAGIEPRIEPAAHLHRDAEMELLIGDATRLRTRTGWHPRRSFEQSAIDTLDYWLSVVQAEP